ncbi:hypothetical protein LSCM1_04328 [Leishmania martiniquensis]|uniref:Uncharacterized protein n=1 Tax=Leishmania martiniquensis TaxID=1580590 RepID=A0A836GEV3_9TRYP|nr:hypothetical protein LSCM1_04328 [Leishmania martiniquensis]
MLSLLIDECGADASDLPQLVRLNELIRAEEEGADGGSATVRTPPPTQSLPPPPLAATATAPVEVTRVAWQASKPATRSVPTPPDDHTMLSFMLNHCASPEEKAQCTVLQRLHGLLLGETLEEGASWEADGNLIQSTAASRLSASAHPAFSFVEDVSRPAQRHDRLAPSGVTATQESRSDTTTAAPLSALPHPAPSPALSIPVPILPDAGAWKGAMTFFHADTALVSRPSSSVVAVCLVSGAATTGVAVAVTDRDATDDKGNAICANTPPSLITKTELLPQNGEWHPKGDRELATVPPSPASLTRESSASQAAHEVPAESEGGRAESEAAAPLLPHYAPHRPSYAGQMPRPVSEALAARNSATARLLAGDGATRPACATPPVPRPVSGFAKRFVAGLYERVSVTRGEVLSSPIPPHQRRHSLQLPQLLAAGSGVGAARGHRAWPERSPARAHLAGPCQARQGVNAARVSLTQGRGPLLAQEVATRPPLCTPPLFELEPLNGVADSGPPRPHRACPQHPAVGSPVVLSGARPLRPPSSLPRSGGASAVESLTGLMVVGTRIHLPSPHPMRPRYS